MVIILIKMGAMPERSSENNKPTSSKKSTIMIAGIIAGIALVGVGYLTIYVEPEIIEEVVEVIAVTEDGCIAETADRFAVNIGHCDAQPGDVLMAPVDQKAKERTMAMLTP